MAKLLGERLREIRTAQGLTQEDLQDRGMSYRYYQRIETGKVNLTLRSLERVASALNVTVWDLFERPDSRKKRTKKGKK
ncbi:MAG: helix-turn-helix transcriptional regulator [Deltaproteobacteria bacterium]|nr:helix-turn-helix transcriptional regulator [Deltaproteobacteria bacterium]